MSDIERSDKVSKLIVIEGALDGIGKSTQFGLLKEKLSKNYNVVSHHFPTYDEPQGSFVMDYLKGSFGKPNEVSPYFANSMYALDRKITWEKKLKKAYQQDNIILLDRYTTSSLIYQSALMNEKDKKEFLDYITDYEYKKLEIKKPDTVIFLNAPFDFITSLRNKRLNEKGEQIKGDIHESDLEFMKKVYESANYCAKYFNWTIIECVKDNKFRDPLDINNEIYSKII